MPTDAEFRALVKRVEELEAFKEKPAATQGLGKHMEGINTHDKLILEWQERSKATVEKDCAHPAAPRATLNGRFPKRRVKLVGGTRP